METTLGFTVDNRRDERHDDLGNMERYRDLLAMQGFADEAFVTIRGADNLPHECTFADMRDRVMPEMILHGVSLYNNKWSAEESVASAQTIDEVLSA